MHRDLYKIKNPSKSNLHALAGLRCTRICIPNTRSSLDSSMRINQLLKDMSFFIDTITSAISEATPKRKCVDPNKHRNPVSWWDSECDKIKRLRQAAYRR